MAGFRPRGRPDFRAEPEDEAPNIELATPRAPDLPAPPPPKAPAPALDLDLPVPPPPTSKPALTQDAGRSSLDDLDDDDTHDPLALDLDTSGGAPLPPAVSSGRLSGRPSIPTPPVSVSGRISAPPSSVRPAKVAVDPYDARALVDYEPPPDAFWMTPLYAYKVLRRRSEVARELADAKEASARADEAAQEALYNLGDRLRPLREAHGGAGLEAVSSAEQVLRTRDSALSSEMDAHKARALEIDTRLAQITQELAEAERVQRAAQAEVDAANEAKMRADARVKRAEIEMRNAQSVRAETPGLELDLAAVHKSVQDFEQQRSAHAAELGQAASLLAQKEAQLAEAKKRTAGIEARAAALRNERNQENARFQRQMQTRSQGSDAARDHYRQALADLARGELGSELPPELEGFRKDAVTAAERAHSAQQKLRLYEAGLESYDKGKVMLGIGLAVGAVTVLLVLVLFPFIYRAIVL